MSNNKSYNFSLPQRFGPLPFREHPEEVSPERDRSSSRQIYLLLQLEKNITERGTVHWVVRQPRPGLVP